MTKRATWAVAIVAVTAFGQGCVLTPDDDVGKFREAIPNAEHVKVEGPESAQATSSSTSFEALSGAKTHDEPWAGGPWSYWYGFTRTVRQGVNHVTGAVLGSVWIIVNTQPTSVTEKEAVWGPYTDALEPATYRFRVTEVGPKEYEYRLEGRLKTSTSEADYVPVLFGKGWGRGHDKHGDGFFTIDLDVARSLDPFNHDADDTGTVKITHDLPPDITDNLFSGPKTVIAEVAPSHTDAWWNASSTTNVDGTGTLFVDAFDDTDHDDGTAKENIQVRSRWKADGAGRADVSISGGDVPQTIGIVTAVECWDQSFTQAYYSDSMEWAPSSGDPSQCAYSEPMSE